MDTVDTVDTVDTEEAVELETATKVSAPIAKVTAILPMHTGSGNAPRREETTEQTTSAFSFQRRLPGHVKVDCVSYKRIKEGWKVKKATTTAALAMTGDCDPF